MSKRLYFDLETSPNIVCAWRIGFRLTIQPENIIKERAIICVSYKWEGEKSVSSISWDAKQNDKTLLEKFMKIAGQADEIVGHNSDKFDLKWLRTRCTFHRIPCPPDFVSIDTLKLARRGFNFNSNKLDYIGGFLGVGRKMDAGGFALWKSVTLDNDRKDLAKMVAYCEQDVRLLEKVHAQLIPYTRHKTVRFLLEGATRIDCPECGGSHVIVNTNRVTGQGIPYKQLQCKGCGKYFSVRTSIYDKLVKAKEAAAKKSDREAKALLKLMDEKK